MYDGIGDTVVTEIDHNHPGNSTPSGYYGNSADVINPDSPIGDAYNAINYPTNSQGQPITRQVYTPADGNATSYDKNQFYPPKKF